MLVVRCVMAFIALCVNGPSWGQAAVPPDPPEKTLTPETTDEPAKVTKTVAASKSGAAMKAAVSNDADDRRLAQIRELVNKKAYAEAEPLALALAAKQQSEQKPTRTDWAVAVWLARIYQARQQHPETELWLKKAVTSATARVRTRACQHRAEHG